ncbi:MAG: glycoside hydrolase family 2 protein [Chitinophagaceae bacterium]
MKFISRHFLIFILAAPILVQAQRRSINLDQDWKFCKTNLPAFASTSHWEKVTLPHTWNALDGQLGKGTAHPTSPGDSTRSALLPLAPAPGMQDGYYRGVCWYERSLLIPESWKTRRIFIRFGAASIVARVYINGHYLGEHRGAFTAFCVELTPDLHFGGINDIRVQVDNTQHAGIPPLSGDFNMDGGLYRPVHLLITSPICVTPLYEGSPGVFCTIPTITTNQAVVVIRSLISNGSKASSPIQIETLIQDKRGRLVCRVKHQEEIPAGETLPVLQQVIINHPHLWNGRKDPYLYAASVRILRGGRVLDQVTQPLGLRTVRISQKRGFLLNGHPYPIDGVCRDQDYRNQGWVLSHLQQKQDARMILNMGATAVRDGHYPMSGYWYRLCDRNGLLIWDEVPLVNETRLTPAFEANSLSQMHEMVAQLYNHPTIAFWGLFNELDNMPTPPSGPFLKQLKDLAKGMDSSRIVVAASDHGNKYYNHIPDEIGFNTYPGWYYGGLPKDEAYTGKKRLMTAYIDARVKEMGKRIAISEYGAGANPAQQEEGALKKPIPWGPFHPEQWQTHVHEEDWGQLKDNPSLWGTFIWTMFDFASSGRHEGSVPGLNDKGLVTEDRKIKKDAYFFYKANWNPSPMVYIASRRLVKRRMDTTAVEVFSNAERVGLTVNGHPLPWKKPDRIQVCRWRKVHLQPGRNLIRATGYFRGKTRVDSCVWNLVKVPAD